MELFVFAVALLSSLARAGINVIDRWQFAYQNESVVKLSFLNNFLPVILGISVITVLGEIHLLVNLIFTIELCILGFIVQMVAMIFSYAFKTYHIYEISLISKISDLSIPIFLGLLTGIFNLTQLLFQVASLLICIPFLVRLNFFDAKKIIYVLLIIFGLTIQAIGSFYLVGSMPHQENFGELIIFCVGIIFWRTVWLTPLYLHSTKSYFTFSYPSYLTLLRVFLTFVTQITFVYVIGLIDSMLAIPILNLTGFFSILMANYFMSEKATRDVMVVIALTLFLYLLSIYV